MRTDMAAVHAALDQLCDPEIPVVSLREMGILRDVHISETGVEVVITPTYSGCPAMEQIHDDILQCLQQLGVQGQVKTQLAPAWTTDWMSPEAKDKLRAYGIAPPHACPSPSGSVVQFAARSARHPAGSELLAVACPQCQSLNTTETSHFGSTACKALYRCLDCLEPFDYFKPY